MLLHKIWEISKFSAMGLWYHQKEELFFLFRVKLYLYYVLQEKTPNK